MSNGFATQLEQVKQLRPGPKLMSTEATMHFRTLQMEDVIEFVPFSEAGTPRQTGCCLL